VVRNAQMILRLVSGVVPRQVWQVTPHINNLGYTPIGEHDVQVPLGDLDAEEGKALLVELLLPPRQPGRYRIAQAEVMYDLPLQSIVGARTRSDVIISYTTDAVQAEQYNAGIMNLIEKVTAYKLQTRALAEAEMGNIQGATQKAARRRHPPARARRNGSRRGRQSGGRQPGAVGADVVKRHKKAALPDAQAHPETARAVREAVPYERQQRSDRGALTARPFTSQGVHHAMPELRK
jgi:hypothetical protein